MQINKSNEYPWTWIADRIRAEKKKHSRLDKDEWINIAAAKIYGNIKEGILIRESKQPMHFHLIWLILSGVIGFALGMHMYVILFV